MLFFTVLLGLTFTAQSQSYNFSVTTSTYANLTGSTSLNNGYTWDDPQYAIPIGFTFQYFNTAMDVIYIGYGLGAFLASDTSETGIYPIITPFGADIVDRAFDINSQEPTTGALSDISYKTEGVAGSRILKIEWKNVGFYGELAVDGISTDFTNFQLWLYEGTNAIEIHWGPALYSQPFFDFEDQTGPIVILFSGFDFDAEEVVGESLVLSGNGASPAMESISSVADVPFLNGTAPNGAVYVFSSTAIGTEETDNIISSTLSISPNPAKDFITVSINGEQSAVKEMRIVDLNGKLLQTVTGYRNSISVAGLIPGTYFMQITTAGGTATRKFVKGI